MKQAPIFKVCNQDAGVTALLKTDNILRVFQFGRAPQNVKKPYAVWQMITGNPENYLNCRPDIEMHSIQIDVYADTAKVASDVLNAIEYAIETSCTITSYHGESRDPDTNDYTVGFDADWYVKR